MSNKSIFIAFILIFTSAIGLLVWRTEKTRANEAKLDSEILKGLSEADIRLILQSEASVDNSGIHPMAENAELRKSFLKGLREYLALAAQARREGLAEDVSFKINFELKKNKLLADLYQSKLSMEKGNFFTLPKEEIEVFLKDQANQNQFETDMETLRSIQIAVARERGDQQAYPKLQGENLTKSRENWARNKILGQRAKSDVDFMNQPQINLRIKILEAGILSADYLRANWAAKIKANEAETAEYLVKNPELDQNKKREKAEIVLKRVLAGESFEKLAAEFSEDRGTAKNGGLYQDVQTGFLWSELENAALSLEKQQVSDKLVETETGFHIVKLENKKTVGDKNTKESITYSVRHILFQKNFADPNHTNPEIPAPFLKAREIAENAVEKVKRNQFVEEIIRLTSIELPQDFSISAKS